MRFILKGVLKVLYSRCQWHATAPRPNHHSHLTACSLACFSVPASLLNHREPLLLLPKLHRTYSCGESKSENCLKSTKALNLRPVEHLNRSSHSSLSESSSTKDLNCLIRTLMGRTGSKHLQEANGASKVYSLLFVWHQSHLICNVLKPCLIGFAVRDHFCKSKDCQPCWYQFW